MDIGTEYLYLGDAPSSVIEPLLLIGYQYALCNTYRQDTFSVHKGSYASIGKLDTSSSSYTSSILPSMQPYIDIVAELVKKHYGYTSVGFHKAMIAILPPGVTTKPHSDCDVLMLASHRVHLSVQTNGLVSFTIGSVDVPFTACSVFEINNVPPLVHSVTNRGLVDRIHLIVDFFPN